MRHKTIISIKTRIHKCNLIVIIGLESNEFVILRPNNIKQNTGLNINEIELLIGSKLRVEFYKVGELTFNNKICDKDNLIVKEYYFELSKPLEILRLENKNQILPYKKIINIFHFNKYEKDTVGIETEDGQKIYLSVKRLEAQSGLNKLQQKLLVDSFINPEYYLKNEVLNNGYVVNEENKTLKWLNLRYSGTFEEMVNKYENEAYENHIRNELVDNNKSAGIYGYGDCENSTFNVAFEGQIDAWNHYNQ